MSTSKFFAGALVGLVAGLLLAPEKGEDLREELAENATKWKKKINKLAGKTGPELEDLRALLSDEIGGLSDDVRSRIMTILDETGDSAQTIKRNVAAEFR